MIRAGTRDPDLERTRGTGQNAAGATRPPSAACTPGRSETGTLLRLCREGESGAREDLVTRFIPLARALALPYRWTGIPLDDLTQVAAVGLLKAIDRFDPDRGTDFGRYAVPTITGELKRCVRDSAWSVHVPRTDKELLSRVRAVSRGLSQQLGRAPSVAEMRQVGVPSSDMATARETAAAFSPLGLDSAYVSVARGDGEGHTYAETVGADDEHYRVVEFWAAIRPTLRTMSARERTMLYLRYVEGRSQAAIGRQLGISQVHVSRLLRAALARLEDELSAELIPLDCGGPAA